MSIEIIALQLYQYSIRLSTFICCCYVHFLYYTYICLFVYNNLTYDYFLLENKHFIVYMVIFSNMTIIDNNVLEHDSIVLEHSIKLVL